MRVLTLTQPWATLVAIGAKQIETRGWRTSYRGPLAIHAAKGFPRWAKELAQEGLFREVLDAETDSGLPTGVIVATATLRHVGRIKYHLPTDQYEIEDSGLPPISDTEVGFGDYTSGRYGWVLSGIVPLRYPIPAKGALGLWEFDHASLR